MDPDTTGLMIPVPAGELVDRLTILAIKDARITDPAKQLHIRREKAGLDAALASIEAERRQSLSPLMEQLLTINASLWDVEESLRSSERESVFDARFVVLARCVYLLNDARASLKRAISLAVGSDLLEEKSYF